MTVLDEIEVSLEKYFENLEFLVMNYQWDRKLPLDVLLNPFKEISTKVKSYHSLYPESKIRESPGDQLLKFITSINNFLIQIQEYFTIHLLTALETINKNLFSILTSEKSSNDLLKTFDEIKLPEIDLNFTRFFYSQIISRWVDVEENYFNVFLSDVQKINEIVPLLKKMFSEGVLTDLRKNKSEELQKKLSPIADKLEQQSLILPGSLSEKIPIEKN